MGNIDNFVYDYCTEKISRLLFLLKNVYKCSPLCVKTAEVFMISVSCHDIRSSRLLLL